jgi:hypothetical protein
VIGELGFLLADQRPTDRLCGQQPETVVVDQASSMRSPPVAGRQRFCVSTVL